MAEVTLKVNGRAYEISCDDGQEEHLRRLGDDLDGRVRELAASIGQIGESRLLVMASLLIADELHETTSALEALRRKGAETPRPEDEAAAAAVLEDVAQRINSLAARLEGP